MGVDLVSLLELVAFSFLGDGHLELSRVNLAVFLRFFCFHRLFLHGLCLLRLSADDLNIEDEGRIGWNRSHLTVTVAVLRWADKLSFAASLKADETFVPTADHGFLANLEAHRLASLVT